MNRISESALAYLSLPSEPELTGGRDFGTRIKLHFSSRAHLKSQIHKPAK